MKSGFYPRWRATWRTLTESVSTRAPMTFRIISLSRVRSGKLRLERAHGEGQAENVGGDSTKAEKLQALDARVTGWCAKHRCWCIHRQRFIAELLGQINMLGQQGNVEEAQAIMRMVSSIKNEREMILTGNFDPLVTSFGCDKLL